MAGMPCYLVAISEEEADAIFALDLSRAVFKPGHGKNTKLPGPRALFSQTGSGDGGRDTAAIRNSLSREEQREWDRRLAALKAYDDVGMSGAWACAPLSTCVTQVASEPCSMFLPALDACCR